MASAYIVMPTTGGEKKVLLANGYMWKIGRQAENDVVVQSDVVSRQHAILQRAEDGGYYLIDMGSRNGSFVNGIRVSVPMGLHDGDQISVGDSQLVFHCENVAAKPDAAKQAVGGSATVALFSCSKTSVLVIDVRNFTVLTQRIDQGLLCQVIGTWFREGGLILQAQGSWAQKYIGDAIMSVWVHREATQQREFSGIIRALVELEAMTATLQSRFGLADPIRIGAGINTGLATIGNTGSGQLTDYTALGDTVNAAFRLESATKETGMDLLIGEETFSNLSSYSKPDVCFSKRTVHLKGYEQAFTVWGASFSGLRKFAHDLATTF